MKLTKRAIEGLETRPQSHFKWDGEVRGFGVRVYPTGKKTYVIQYRIGKRSRRMTLGQHGPLTTDEARRLAMRHLGHIAQGADPAEDIRIVVGSLMLATQGLGYVRADIAKSLERLGVRYGPRQVSIGRTDFYVDILALSLS